MKWVKMLVFDIDCISTINALYNLDSSYKIRQTHKYAGKYYIQNVTKGNITKERLVNSTGRFMD